MKPYLTLTLIASVVLSTVVSCTKDSHPPAAVERKVHYILYTNKDFSDDNHTITFSLFMRNGTRTLLDSALAPMKIKDVPDFAHRIEFEKTVPANESSVLTVGFVYAIEGVGVSWFLDTCSERQTFKVLEYPFQ